MPSKRFFNLPEEKQEAIRKAAIEEFCRVPFESVSINMIIKDAGISRGSFYTYFEDKRDLMKYLMDDIIKKENELMQLSLKRAGGDFFKACDLLLEHYIKYFVDQEVFKFAKAMMDQGAFSTPMLFDDKEYERSRDELARWVWDNMDRNFLSLENLSELKGLLLLVQMTITVTVVRYCFIKETDGDTEVIRRPYEEMMEIIKNGALKKENRH